MKKKKIIQDHRLLAKRLFALSSAALQKDDHEAYKDFKEQAEEHERKANTFRQKTFIFMR